ncbi:PEP-CTERM sorting domain-containing protein [Xylophilus rhododendri]|nr:PEP-CTERM sorting domain-containing protein [Xylophilus rhododendri]
MKKLFLISALALPAFFGSAHAANADLTTFTTALGINGTTDVSPNFAELFATASITGYVSGLTSFEWNFSTTDIYIPNIQNDFSYYTVGSTTVELADVASLSGTPLQPTGWQTVTFSTAYTGMITIGVANYMDDNAGSTLDVRNLVVAAVPEPESYAMLLAGLGCVGSIATRRRKRRHTTT